MGRNPAVSLVWKEEAAGFCKGLHWRGQGSCTDRVLWSGFLRGRQNITPEVLSSLGKRGLGGWGCQREAHLLHPHLFEDGKQAQEGGND